MMKGVLNIMLSSEKNIAKVVNGKKYVYWGKYNAYPNYLIDLYKYSSKHNAIINAKHRYICGTVEEETYRVGVNGESLYDLFCECVFSYLIYGGFVISKKQIANKIYIEILPLHKCRVDEDFSVLYFGKFVKNLAPFKYTSIVKEDIDEYELNKDIVFIFDDKFDDLYPTPEYNGATNVIELDYLISNFWNNYLNNNLSSGYLINVYGKHNLREEEKESIANEFLKAFSGTDNAGKVIVQFPADKDKATEIQPIDTPDFVDKYETLNKSILQEIFVAHNITSPMLFGVRVEGQLGGRNELLDAFELFSNTYVIPTRTKILNWLNAVTDGLFKNLNIKDVAPINEDILKYKGILTIDEIREKIGYAALNNNAVDTKVENVNVAVEKAKDRFIDILSSRDSGANFDSILSTHDAPLKPNSDNEFELLMNSDKLKLSKDVTISKYELEILRLLNLNPQLDVSMLAAFTGLSERNVNTTIRFLITKQLLIAGVDGNSFFVTKKGKELLTNRNLIYTDIRYSYDWREGFSDADRKTSREFCKKLMQESKRREKQNKLWTRADIEQMSAEVGYDVWSMRGGWYRLPGTEISVPYCRHTWKQHIVVVKNAL